jgi:hypothetical protein
VFFFVHGGHVNISKPYSNLKKWTDVPISIAGSELARRGINVVEDASKTLAMTIESVKTGIGWFVVRSQIVMLVKTSDGYSATYIGKDKWSYYFHFLYYPVYGDAFIQGLNTALMNTSVKTSLK